MANKTADTGFNKLRETTFPYSAEEEISERSFNLTIGITLAVGFLINTAMAMFLTPYILRLNQVMILILYLGGSIGGMLLAYKTRSTVLSFAGFGLLSISMGLILTFFLAGYAASQVYTAFLMTGIVTVIMLIASVLAPALFLGLGKVLSLALLASLAVELIGRFLFRIPLGIMDYVVVLVFAGYIGFDWARAQSRPKTIKYAVVAAADIYVDVINIFIRILSIIGKKD